MTLLFYLSRQKVALRLDSVVGYAWRLKNGAIQVKRNISYLCRGMAKGLSVVPHKRQKSGIKGDLLKLKGDLRHVLLDAKWVECALVPKEMRQIVRLKASESDRPRIVSLQKNGRLGAPSVSLQREYLDGRSIAAR